MSERGLPIADGAQACPFVAFEDDRDERAGSPDHRHRCYAEIRPAPRALAHQEAYCLSSAFPVCPTFQDWARREAARARSAPPARRVETRRVIAEEGPEAASERAAAAASGAAALAAAAAGRFEEVADTEAEESAMPGSALDGPDDGSPAAAEEPLRPHYDDEEPRRNPPREWSAPPPWLASAEAAAHDRPVDSTPDFLSRRTADPAQGLAGSAADRLAGGPPPSPRRTVPAGPPAIEPDADAGAADDHAAPRTSRRPRAYGQHLGGPTSGPDWERPRRYEAYPTIRTRIGMPAVPRTVLMAIAVAIAALALFFLPALFVGNDGRPAASGTPVPSGSSEPSASVAPTPTPAPTPILYTIRSGDTLSKIAAANGLTLDELLAANPEITNPNRITVGQQIVIPVPSPSPPQEFGSAAPSESPAP